MSLDRDWDDYQKEVKRTMIRRLFFGESIPLEREYQEWTTNPFAIDVFDISAVEILRLHPFDTSSIVSKQRCKVLKTTRFTGVEALEIASSWSQLVNTDHYIRCHNPKYGVRLYTPQGLLVEATICWLCRTIVLWNPEMGFAVAGFRSQGFAARKLLKWCVKSTWIRSRKSA